MTTTATPMIENIIDQISAMSVWQLARFAECQDPSNESTEGAVFLDSTRRSVIESLRDLEDISDWDENTTHEIADSAPDVYTHRRWLEFVDLCAYREDLSDYSGEMTDLAGIALYLIAERLVNALITEEYEVEISNPHQKITCPECGRVFDLFDENDAQELEFGHDCES